MLKKLKIGIVGYGAIGSSLAKVIRRDFSRSARLVAIYDLDKAKAGFINRKLLVNSLLQLIKKSDLVIECSSAGSSWGIAKSALTQGRSVMIMSVGGVIRHYRQLRSLAGKHNAKVYIPSGAISGIDALKAARIGRIKKVMLTTRKNPLAFKGVKFVQAKGIKLEKIRKDTCLFSGPASKAVKYFPQNINVAAVLSLAGIGPDKTLIKIVASPSVHKNIHEIQINSEAADIFTRTENILHPDNPKTSYLAVLAAVATLEQIIEPVKIGT